MSFPICSLFNENGVSATTQAYTFGFPFSGLFSRKRIFEIVGAAFFYRLDALPVAVAQSISIRALMDNDDLVW